MFEELTTAAISRAITLIYTLSLLNLLTRIQLNLLGRRNYLSSVVALAAPSHRDRHISLENKDDDNLSNAYSNDFDVNRKYLAFSWWLLHRGSQAIVEQVSSAVEKVFRTVNPRDELTVKDLSGLMLDVRRHMEGSTVEDRRYASPRYVWLHLIR